MCIIIIMYSGTIQHWNNIKGYGLAQYNNGFQILVHHSEVKIGNPIYSPGFIGFNRHDSITFDNENNIAKNVRYVSKDGKVVDIDEALDQQPITRKNIVAPNVPVPKLDSDSDEYASDSDTDNNMKIKTPNTNRVKPNKKKQDNTIDDNNLKSMRQPVFKTPPRTNKTIK